MPHHKHKSYYKFNYLNTTFVPKYKNGLVSYFGLPKHLIFRKKDIVVNTTLSGFGTYQQNTTVAAEDTNRHKRLVSTSWQPSKHKAVSGSF